MTELQQAIINLMKNDYNYNFKMIAEKELIFQIDCDKSGRPTSIRDENYKFSSFCKVTAITHPKQSKFSFEYILDDQKASLKSVEYFDICRTDFIELEKQFLKNVRKLIKKK